MRTAKICLFLGVMLAGFAVTAHAEKFGALAYDMRGGSWGGAWDHITADAASAQAMRRCSARGAPCVIVVRFMGDCGAFAKGSGGAYGWAHAETKDLVLQQALASCQEKGTGCRVRAWACNSQSEKRLSQITP